MASEYSYQLTRKALEDLDDAVGYIANKLGSPSSASAFLEKMESALSEICSYPKIVPSVRNDYLNIHGIRKNAVGNFLLYFLPDEKNQMITILRIVYGKRDTDTILKQLEYQ